MKHVVICRSGLGRAPRCSRCSTLRSSAAALSGRGPPRRPERRHPRRRAPCCQSDDSGAARCPRREHDVRGHLVLRYARFPDQRRRGARSRLCRTRRIVLLPMLGVRPALGRLFADADGRSGSQFVAVLSDGLWRRNLRSRSSVCWPIAGRQRASPPHRRRAAAGLLHRLHDGGACRDLSALASVAIGIGQGPKTRLYAGDSFFSDRAISVMRCPYSRAAVIGSPDSVFAGTTTIPAQAAAA